jgi:hypothetical protein
MDNSDNELNEMLEKYLDNQLSDSERREFEVLVDQQQGGLAEAIELQAKIDDSLQRICAPPTLPSFVLPSLESLKTEDQQSPLADASNFLLGGLDQALDSQDVDHSDDQLQPGATGGYSGDVHHHDVGERTSGPRRSRFWTTALVSSAAALIWLFVGLQFFSTPPIEEVAFEQIPLSDVFLRTVDEGFKPYWFCDDPVTFANTFQVRQGVPLKLEVLPSNSEMLGLAYLAGVSNKSTSLLALVDDQPVLVMVDRIENDWRPETGYIADKGVYVTRKEKFGLVFYELSKIGGEHMIQYLTEVPSQQ